VDDQELAKTARKRVWKFYSAIALAVLGVPAMAAGFIFGQRLDGDVATGWGVLAGIGFSFILAGAIFAWRTRPGDRRWMSEAPQSKRDRMQAQRSSQLFLFPAVAVIFLALAWSRIPEVLAGEGRLADYLSISLPVLYAWLTAAITMGWDGNSRSNRRFLEDELTVVLRARAVTAAFVVLMTGATASLGLFLVRPEYGAIALLTSIAAAGATAGVRFAWLDREAGQDG
jgi:Kef-type K+ transport system membrane component KefB